MTFRRARRIRRETGSAFGMRPRRNVKRTLAMWVRTHKPRCDYRAFMGMPR